MNFDDNDNNNKSMVPYTGVPAVPPPPPPPKTFTLEFKNLVEKFEVHRKDFITLQADFEKRNYPVKEFLCQNQQREDSYHSAWSFLTYAQILLEKLQALWPEENLYHQVSRQCIGVRLNGMAKRLPKSENSHPKSLIERIEAELPSVMVLESTCQELEDTATKFPMPTDILPVLEKQKKLWAKRMAAVDISHIEQINSVWEKAYQEQQAIFEKAVRERVLAKIVSGSSIYAKFASTKYKDLLTLLDIDPDKRVADCVHYVLAIVNLLQENCGELADKLYRCLETYQRCALNEEDDLTAFEELDQVYNEAGPIIEKKRHERVSKEREQKRKEHEWQEECRRYREEQDRAEQHQLLIEEACCDEMARAHAEWLDALVNDYDPWDHVSPEQYEEIKKGIPQLTAEQRAERLAKEKHDQALRDVHDLQHELLQELKSQREVINELREQAWQDAIEAIPMLQDRVKDLEQETRDLQDQIRDLQR